MYENQDKSDENNSKITRLQALTNTKWVVQPKTPSIKEQTLDSFIFDPKKQQNDE